MFLNIANFTAFIIMNLADATAFHNAIPGSINNGNGIFNIPCSTTVQIEFVFNSITYLINTQDLYIPESMPDGTQVCESNILGTGQEALWIVGSPFLRNVSHEIFC
jgi:Eukaryotic aspartyl protease